MAAGRLVLVVYIVPEQLRNITSSFLRELSRVLHTNVLFRKDARGELMLYPYYGSDRELGKHNRKRSADWWGGGAAAAPGEVEGSLSRVLGRDRRELDHIQIKG